MVGIVEWASLVCAGPSCAVPDLPGCGVVHADRGPNAREIATDAMRRHGVIVHDEPILRRVTNSLLASLGKTDGLVVQSDDGCSFRKMVA